MTINKDTPIHRILAAYPQLIHRLVKRDHWYAYLNNSPSTCASDKRTTVENIAFLDFSQRRDRTQRYSVQVLITTEKSSLTPPPEKGTKRDNCYINKQWYRKFYFIYWHRYL